MKRAVITVEVGGRELPCRVTCGAMLRFKHATGKEVSELDGGLSELVTWLWCCVASACKADDVEFGMTLEEFADRVDPEVFSAWADAAGEESAAAAATGEKKTE